MNIRTLFSIGVVATLAACSSGGGDGLPVAKLGTISSTGLVNTSRAGDQQTPAVARNKLGYEVVVWDTAASPITNGVADGKMSDIHGQLYRNGAKFGGEFAVNTYTDGRQNLPAVAMDDAGNFVVIWRSSGEGGDFKHTTGFDGGTIFGRLYYADGSARTGEFLVGPDDSNFDSQTDPAVAMNGKGQFAVAFSNRLLSPVQAELNLLNLGETRKVMAHAFNADGSSIGGIVTVSSSTSSIERTPGIGMAADGSFVVGWISDGSPSTINAQRYSASASKVGSSILVSDTISGSDHPVVAQNAAGTFVISWERLVAQPDQRGIYAALYKADGTAIKGQFQIAPNSVAYERSSVGIDDSGSFVIAAAVAMTRGGNAITLSSFDAAGNYLGSVGPMNDTAKFGMFPRLSMDGSGNLSLVWHGYDKTNGRDVYHLTISN